MWDDFDLFANRNYMCSSGSQVAAHVFNGLEVHSEGDAGFTSLWGGNVEEGCACQIFLCWDIVGIQLLVNPLAFVFFVKR